MSENYKDIIRTFPQPRQILGDFKVPTAIAGDKANPVMMVNISIPLQPSFIETAVKSSLAMGIDKAIVLRFLYQLDDIIHKLIDEVESSDDVHVKRKVL